MSLLKMSAEDIVSSRMKDPRMIAKSSLSNKDKDLVSDPERSGTDEVPAVQSDKVAMGGHEVHQEAENHNSEAFFNLAEQEAFIKFMAAKEMMDPITGNKLFSDLDFMSIVSSSFDFKQLRDRVSEMLTSSQMLSDEKFLKAMKSWTNKVESMKKDSSELLLWKTLTSSLQPAI